MAISAVGKLFKKSALSFYSKKKKTYQLTSLEIMMLFHNKDSASVTSVLCVAHAHPTWGSWAGLGSPHPPQAKPPAPSSGDGERGTEKVPSALLRTKNTLKANQVFISVTTFES